MRIVAVSCLMGLAALPAAAAQVEPWSDLVVFGDSLSDPGNFGPGLVATDGEVWAEQLGAGLGSGTNFAYGGATAVSNGGSPDFAEQRALFVAADPELGPDPVAVVWFGGNDLLNATGPEAIGDAVDAVVAGVLDLAGYGLDRIVIPGLPDLGLIPAVRGTPLEQAATAASDAFNAAIQAFVALEDSFSLDLAYVDIDGLFDDVLGDPAAYGFTDVTGTCQQGAVPCDGYLFWDGIHPTEAAHSLIAGAILDAAAPAPIPLPASALTLLGALGALLGLGRRRARAG